LSLRPYVPRIVSGNKTRSVGSGIIELSFCFFVNSSLFAEFAEFC